MYLNSKFKFTTLPAPIVREIWKQFEITDLFVLAMTSDDTDWFSKNVFRKPTKFFINFVSSHERYQDHWTITIEFPENKTLVWRIQPYMDMNFREKMKFKVGRFEMLSKYTLGPPKVLHSVLHDYKDGILEVLEILIKFFQCQPNEVFLGARSFWDFSHFHTWIARKQIPLMKVGSCQDSEFFNILIKGRRANNLRTHFSCLEFDDPIKLTLPQMLSISFTTARIHLTLFTFEDIIAITRQALSGKFDVFRAMLPVLTPDQVLIFRAELGLSIAEHIGRTHHAKFGTGHVADRHRRFQLAKEDGSFLVFYFFQIAPGMYNRMTVQRWVPRTYEEDLMI